MNTTTKRPRKKMLPKSYSVSITCRSTATEAFKKINDVAAWWTEDFKGRSKNMNDEFTVSFGATWMTHEVIELIPGKKIVWMVTDCYKHWLKKNKQEWKGTTLKWEISGGMGETQITFTHVGLLPGIECYDGCEKAWNYYIRESLLSLLENGKGMPEQKTVL